MLLPRVDTPTKRRLIQTNKVPCEVYTMSRRGFRSCPQCSDNVPAARKRCVCGCGLKKGRDRPKGTTRIEGYGVNTSGGETCVYIPQQRRGIPLLCCGIYTQVSPPLVLTPYPSILVVPLGRSRPFFRPHPHTQRFRAAGTLSLHCGHDLKPRRLIVYTSHGTLLVCINRLLVGVSTRGRSIQETV